MIMNMKNYFFRIILFPAVFQLINFTFLSAQDTLLLMNPSFEDLPRAGTLNTPPIFGWRDCGLTNFPGESPPDIHPVFNAAWGVTMRAEDGNTYLGLVVRDNATYESISQRIKPGFIEGKCYSCSVFLARSDTYLSSTRESRNALKNFVQPTVLQIWAGNNFCEKQELLAQSIPIENNEWMKYEFVLSPKLNYTFFTIEAFYALPILEAYNGHILVDNFSPIVEVECN
jgi:hypothetical protein